MERSPRILIALLLPAISAWCSSCTLCAPRSVRVGTDPVFYLPRGEGRPVVVLESDLGDGYESWLPLLDRIGDFATVFAYSRPGYPPGSAPHRAEPDGRHMPEDVAGRLRDVLRSVGLAPPYVLVGHGCAGTYLFHFAATHPEEVAGIVLVEGRLHRFHDRCRLLGLDACRPPGRWTGRISEHVREEMRGLRDGERTAPGVGDLGDVPVTVITAAPPQRTAKTLERWNELKAALQDRIPRGRLVAAQTRSHYVHREEPNLVIGEVRAAVERARAAR